MKELKYSKAPSVIFRLPIRSTQQRMLLFVLASMENTDINPTQGLLGYSIGTHGATVSSHLADLAKDGWIKKITPKNRFNGDTCKYEINWGKIEKHTTDKDYFSVDDGKNVAA